MPKTDNHNKMYINKDGKRVMRVTEVIKVLAKDQLVVWANMLGFKGVSYQKELERTSSIGSMCHDVLEKYFDKRSLANIDFDEFGITDQEDQDEVSRALGSFFDWYEAVKDRYPFKIKFQEKVVVGKLLGGTIDLGIEGWKDPNKAIFVDYKTSKDFYLTQFLQLAGYVLIYEEEYGEDTVEGVMVCRLDKRKNKNAEAWFISRENLKPYIICFQCLYDTAVGTRILNGALREHVVRIG